MDIDDIRWRLFEIHKASMAAVGRSQTHYVNGLLAFMAVVWGWYYMKPEGMAVQFLGISFNPSGLWTIAPAVLSVLALGLIGTMNAMGAIWERLRRSAEGIGQNFFWTDLDVYKNIVDYLVFLRLHPEGSAEPTVPPNDTSRKWQLSVFSYPLVLLAAIVTTICANYPHAPLGTRVYIFGCAVIQTVFSFRIWYRAVCRFLGVRRPQTEI